MKNEKRKIRIFERKMKNENENENDRDEVQRKVKKCSIQ